MDKKQLDKILEAHKKWVEGAGGERANLSGADLRGADLREADLSGADLRGQNIIQINFSRYTVTISPEKIWIGCETYDRKGKQKAESWLKEIAAKYDAENLLPLYRRVIKDALGWLS